MYILQKSNNILLESTWFIQESNQKRKAMQKNVTAKVQYKELLTIRGWCCWSVAQSYPTLCDPMNCSIPGPCPLLSSGVCSNSCPLSRQCHPIISSKSIGILKV